MNCERHTVWNCPERALVRRHRIAVAHAIDFMLLVQYLIARGFLIPIVPQHEDQTFTVNLSSREPP